MVKPIISSRWKDGREQREGQREGNEKIYEWVEQGKTKVRRNEGKQNVKTGRKEGKKTHDREFLGEYYVEFKI